MLVLIALLAIGVSLGIIFRYTFLIQTQYYTTALKLARSGVNVTAVATGVAPFQDLRTEALVEESPPRPPDLLYLTGPAQITIGVPTKYKAEKGPQGGTRAPVEATWTTDPVNIAVVNPAKGSEATVIAAVEGTFKLQATVDDIQPPAEIEITAVALAANQVQLPVFGGGYGAIAIAIVLMLIVLVLGLANVLPSAAIASLLGGLLGYIFGSQAGGSSGRPGGAPPAGSAGNTVGGSTQ